MGTEVPEYPERDLTGFKYFDRLIPLVARLYEVGCARDTAHNRTLHYDHYCLLLLLALFNPTLRSLRALQQASTLKKVQRQLGCPRTSLGALSEAAALSVSSDDDPLADFPAGADWRPVGSEDGLAPSAPAADGPGVKFGFIPADEPLTMES